MNELTTISNIDITKPADFASFVAYAKSLQDALDNAWKQVDEQMNTYGITKLEGDWGRVSRAERKNWKVNLNDLPDYYQKATADTGKLNAAYKAGETVPGADFSVSTYITKTIKATQKVEA